MQAQMRHRSVDFMNRSLTQMKENTLPLKPILSARFTLELKVDKIQFSIAFLNQTIFIRFHVKLNAEITLHCGGHLFIKDR